ncbi:hypothetical protein GTY75_12425 [Streptomyces sp. SID8381]|uniref:hypothetical protein n=1 Tax=unclassified Streptomyces TaxID=2593676 RepID=UPI00035CB6AE|nr:MULTISPECIES: hypothetical protein [unclassified Streptomyces]MYX27447.1 hypothetical protein [Streptomyces sp. SID8381]
MSAAGHKRLPSEDGRLVRSAFEMRPITTRAEQAEARALVQDRLDWLAHRNLPADPAAAGLFTDSARQRVGLYEDEVLIGCMLVDADLDLRHWRKGALGPSLLLQHVYSAPGQSGILRLVSLWAAHYAACVGLPCLRAEIGPLHIGPLATLGRLLRHAQSLGWQTRGYGPGLNGDRVAYLELPAQARPGLTPLISSTVTSTPGMDRSTS